VALFLPVAFFAPFFGAAGTFAPFFRASESPIAIACLGFVTFLPLRPDFNLPCFISRISVSTDLEALGLYFRDAFFVALFLAVAMRRSSQHWEAEEREEVARSSATSGELLL
jgi:hypothetical protein